jgi:hypothetical protein
MTVAPPKSKERLAREDLYGACLAQKVHFDAADALSAEVGVVEATRLIRAHGTSAGFSAMASRIWAGHGVTPPRVSAPVAESREFLPRVRSVDAFTRRTQALGPGRADERPGDNFGSEEYASDVYQRREVAV